MNILLASSEAVPFCKTGGLGDVAGVLARELAGRFDRGALFLPRYRQIARRGLESAGRLSIPGFDGLSVELLRSRAGRLEVFFVDCPKYFDREHLYQEQGKDYPDNAQRFTLFCRAVLEGIRLVGLQPDLIHCHDWQTALIPAYVKIVHRRDHFFARMATLLTIHNAAYQGLFPKEAFSAAGFPEAEFTPRSLEYHGKFNFLKAGLMTADLLNTVSPSYAREIQESEEFGRGLEGVLRHRREDLSGILNGLDLKAWDPGTDAHLPCKYGPDDFAAGKAACRRALAARCGLEIGTALIGVVSRLDPQKGLDIALEVLPRFLGRGAALAALGTGDARLAQGFSDLARRFPREAYFRGGFDDPFAHLIYAACDVFLMPSRFEPCGLGQMIAMRYGAVPVGTKTGGLADTIVEGGSPGRPNGFLAEVARAEDVARALERALRAYGTPAWPDLVRTGMKSDFSWDRAIERYVELYKEARRRREQNAVRTL